MQITFIFILASFTGYAAGASAGVPYPDKKLLGMMGFAKKGSTVGGSEGEVVFLNNLEDLKQHISDEVPQTLVLAATIHNPKKETIFLGSNKSLIGSYKTRILNNVYLHTAKNSSNIIFQNLLFKHNPKNIDNSDTQLILEYGGRYWVDHCTFDGGKIDVNDKGKLISIKAVTFVTVSYCKFIHHTYGAILGYPTDHPTGAVIYKGLPLLTMIFNYFEDIIARSPGLMRYGKFHVMNNLMKNCQLGFTIGFQCEIFSESNVFIEPRKNAESVVDKGTGFFKDSGSILMPEKIKPKEDKWHPSTDYHYIVHTTNYTRTFCEQFSGSQNKKLKFAANDNS